MTTKVSEHGLLIPKGLLQNVDEVEIREENGIIVIIPRMTKDPISELGQNPVTADVDDASINHDMYLHS